MTPTDALWTDAENDELAEALGIDGWKRGQRCAGSTSTLIGCDAHHLVDPHDIPAPKLDTIEAMGKVVSVLFAKGYRVYIKPEWELPAIIQIDNDDEVWESPIENDNLPLALCRAALSAIRRER